MSLAPGTPIVVFGDDWGRHVSTMQHTFRWINDRFPVVWVNGIGHRRPRFGAADLRRAWQKGRAMLRGSGASGPPLGWGGGGGGGGDTDAPPPRAVIEPRVLPWHDQPAVRAYNTRWLVGAVRRTLAREGLTRPPVLVTGTPPSAGVVGRLGESAAIYFCMDDFLHLPSVSADMLAPLERELLDKVDVVVCTAERLTQLKVPRSGRTRYLPQGVNYDHLAAPRGTPADLAGLPRPRIGFAGGLYPRCDLALLQRLAERTPHGSVVLVGPVAVDLSRLTAPNIHVLGSRPYADLPGYLQAFDVGIIPYLVNDETVAVDPLKLLEYLAAGIPVVTTALPEARKYAGDVAIAASSDDFVAAVEAALVADRATVRAAGQARARANTWERRAVQFLDILGDAAAARAAS